jgi:hypothetical protein
MSPVPVAPPAPASATRTKRSLRRGSSLAALLDEPEAPPADASPAETLPEAEAPKPLESATVFSNLWPSVYNNQLFAFVLCGGHDLQSRVRQACEALVYGRT